MSKKRRYNSHFWTLQPGKMVEGKSGTAARSDRTRSIQRMHRLYTGKSNLYTSFEQVFHTTGETSNKTDWRLA